MKKEAKSKKRARLIARGFEQVDGKQNKRMTSRRSCGTECYVVSRTLIVMLDGTAVLCDVNGALLFGDLEADLNMFMRSLQGFEK